MLTVLITHAGTVQAGRGGGRLLGAGLHECCLEEKVGHWDGRWSLRTTPEIEIHSRASSVPTLPGLGFCRSKSAGHCPASHVDSIPMWEE